VKFRPQSASTLPRQIKLARTDGDSEMLAAQHVDVDDTVAKCFAPIEWRRLF
jgi:hypothetical protein